MIIKYCIALMKTLNVTTNAINKVMSIVDQLSAWVLGIYTDKALGAKVLESIMNVLNKNDAFYSFLPNMSTNTIAWVFAMNGDTLLEYTIDLSNDVELSVEENNGYEGLIMKYPLSLIK